jgi:hypothetical protein
MWLEAIITQEDLVQVMRELLPVKIHLHKEEPGEATPPERWLLLHPATHVALVPDQGLRVTCPAELRWSIAGVSPTVKLDELGVLIRPQVVDKNKGHVLEFQLEIEETDFHSLPEFIDATIIKAINPALAAKKVPWNFTETFTRTVALGKMFEPVEALKIEVLWGKHRIGSEALTLVVSFKIGFARGD